MRDSGKFTNEAKRKHEHLKENYRALGAAFVVAKVALCAFV